MNFIKIKELKNGYPEKIEGTNEWYYCKMSENSFCDLFEAEDIVKMGMTYEGMNCLLIHFPDGKVYSPFELNENVYVDAPVYWDGKLYFLVTDFHEKWIQIVSVDEKTLEKNIVTQIALDEVKDCYNLMLRVAPVTLVYYEDEGDLKVVWPEKRTIKLRENESMCFRDGDKLYCSEWYEDPHYHENIIVRDWNTGEIEECFEGVMCRMPSGDIWVM